MSRDHIVEVSRDFVGGVPSVLNHHPARFGAHRSYRTGKNGVCCISSNSNSNPNAKVPMPRFTNGRLFIASNICYHLKIYRAKSCVQILLNCDEENMFFMKRLFSVVIYCVALVSAFGLEPAFFELLHKNFS